MAAEKSIEDLEQEIDKLEHEEQELREELAGTQLKQWEDQIEDLQVQLHLGAMEVRDRVAPIVAKVHEQILESRSRVEGGATSASDAATALRHGVAEAWRDVRAALAEARDALRT